MNAIRAIWTKGQIVPTEPVNWPEGKKLIVGPEVSNDDELVSGDNVWGDDPESFEPAKDDVVAPVRQPLEMCNHAAAPERVDRRSSFVIVFPPRPQQCHADNPIASQRIGDHLAITGLEDVERQKNARKKHDVR